ncbi:glia-derived nexin [Trichophyton mentagrophytes]|uniref:Serpin domain-containing protein n=1 Tax=Trichophyton interdigitale (strain MR816) TaxID=1215338 RepID=A0A059J1U8_TRIIM|nr:hypothetical protein H101_03291 [Trichophyton interdigitale H6]KDB21861.1 hypothetical protein H109_06210 [Trichophyton interdigitale MR816]GBF62856.1 glia-derived nexin [Trichophyton mentagrophytes]
MAVHPAYSCISHTARAILLDLCGQEIPESGFAISPASIGIAMAMLIGAATPSDAARMCTSLGVARPEQFDVVHHLLKHCKDTTAVANAIFADKGTVLDDGYARFLDGFEVCANMEFPRLLDGLATINGWISDNTMGMINNMIHDDNLAHSHLVLINALAFKGIWKEKFDQKNTVSDYPFKVTDSDIRRVDMMFRFGEEIFVWDTPKYNAVKLPYEAESFSASTSFKAYLPRDGVSVQEVLSSLSSEQAPFRQKKVSRLGFPKIDMSYGTDLFKTFPRIGTYIPSGFPKMGAGENVLSAILHNTAITIDEQGTRAAAATAVMMTRSALGPSTVLVFNKPFVFSIESETTQCPLFMGVFFPKR